MISKIKYHLKNIVYDFLYLIGVPYASLPIGELTILAYHGISNEPSSKFLNGKFINDKLLENHFSWFVKNCHLVSIDDVKNNKLSAEKHNICITFDDGFENNFIFLTSLLDRLKLPISLFITPIQLKDQNILWPDVIDIAFTQDIDQVSINSIPFKKKKGGFFNLENQNLKNYMKLKGDQYIQEIYDNLLPRLSPKSLDELAVYWKLLSKNQIKDFSESSYVTIGTHGVVHANSEFLTDEKLKEEMTVSKTYLESIIGEEVKYWAYPDGSFNNRTLQIGRDVGYHLQLLAESKLQEKIDDAPIRLTINPFISLGNQVRAIANRKYL